MFLGELPPCVRDSTYITLYYIGREFNLGVCQVLYTGNTNLANI